MFKCHSVKMANSKEFSGKVVIITGSTSGIGEASAIHLSKLGANVVITGRNAENVQRVAKLCVSVSPKQLKPLEVVGDITKDEFAKTLIDTTIKTFGQIDVLVNNAGASLLTSIYDNDLIEKYEKIMRLDTRSAVYLSHLAVPYLEKTKGNIINISSVVGLKPFKNFFVYCMSKAALDMFTKCLAIELGPKGIRVNSINPGPVATNFGIAMGLSADQGQQMLENLAKSTVLGKVGQPQDIANSVAFLASNEAQFITGSILVQDGGVMFGNV